MCAPRKHTVTQPRSQAAAAVVGSSRFVAFRVERRLPPSPPTCDTGNHVIPHSPIRRVYVLNSRSICNHFRDRVWVMSQVIALLGKSAATNTDVRHLESNRRPSRLPPPICPPHPSLSHWFGTAWQVVDTEAPVAQLDSALLVITGGQSASQPARQPTNQPTSQPASQPASQLANQPYYS